jgi:triosephosphate isomerase
MSPVVVGVSLKMYFGHTRAREWFDSVARLARENESVADRAVELFVIPSFLAIPAAIETLAGTNVVGGAQDLFWEDGGAYTGEISGAELAELGVGVVEVGHAERRRIFGENEQIVAAKTAAALRNGIAPVLCIGELVRREPDAAAREVVEQLHSALEGAPAGRVIVAYEPVWAIGAAEPAEPAHIRAVCARLRAAIADLDGRNGSSVIYGGSAGPGLLSELGSDVDGVFLGRFAHDPAALASVLDEAATLAGSTVRP